jgi:hypothetical protein
MRQSRRSWLRSASGAPSFFACAYFSKARTLASCALSHDSQCFDFTSKSFSCLLSDSAWRLRLQSCSSGTASRADAGTRVRAKVATLRIELQ